MNYIDTGEYIEVNNAFEKITGFSGEEVVGRSSLELNIWKNPGDRNRFIAGLKKDGFVDGFEAQFRAKDGTPIQAVKFGRILSINGKRNRL